MSPVDFFQSGKFRTRPGKIFHTWESSTLSVVVIKAGIIEGALVAATRFVLALVEVRWESAVHFVFLQLRAAFFLDGTACFWAALISVSKWRDRAADSSSVDTFS